MAQTKTFLESIHQSRSGPNSSPLEIEIHQQKKLPFDTQDLHDLVVRANAVTRSLKDVVRRAEGVSVSPDKTPGKPLEPAFSQIFHQDEPPLLMFPNQAYREAEVQTDISEIP